MLNKLKMTCFRQHTDLEINFTAGLNAIRGSNEAGKSTILLAISYAFFGSAALSQPLEEIVTYDVPVSKLRVELDFEHAGVSYHIYRGKSGAELTFGNETVTGQTEVTKFVERLFGASAKLANKLMIARQKELSGILDEGPTAVGGLIETLANFELLDEIIEAVTTELPAGNTKSLEGRIEGLQVASGESQLEDLTLLNQQVVRSASDVVVQRLIVKTLDDQVDSELLKSARDTLIEHDKLSAKLDDVGKRKAVQVELSNKEIDGVCPTDEEISKLEMAVNDAVGATKLYDLYQSFLAYEVTPLWEGTVDELLEARDHTKGMLSTEEHNHRQLVLDKNTYTGKLIKETSCAFCDKDLTDVPEVVKRNSEFGAKIADVDTKIGLVVESIASLKAELAELESVLSVHQRTQVAYAAFGDHIELDKNVVPHTAKWLVVPAKPGANQSTKLAELKALKVAHVRHQTMKEQAEAQVKLLQEDQKNLLAGLEELDITQAKAIIAHQEDLTARLEVAKQHLRTLEHIETEAKHTLALSEARNKQIIDSAAKAREDLAKAKEELVEMQANNALIKKLREARPKITDKIWGMVLAAVTTYFTDIREVKSVVTKDADGFKVNGKSAKGLSGSAEDALGLAIRTSLTKTFLPNTDSILLDEMAAACDDRREAAMLGMIAKCGFPQVIMVTHSDQCDAYADNMIRLGE